MTCAAGTSCRARRCGIAGGGGTVAGEPREALAGAEAVITMLPAGEHVRAAYLGDGGIIARVGGGAPAADRLLDDRRRDARARSRAAAADAGLEMLDAPVSGGVGGATAGTLTFMVGGTGRRLRARRGRCCARWARTSCMPARAGAGQAAKICNNMMLGIAMIAHRRGVRARRQARPGPAEAVRHRQRVLGPELVADRRTARCPARCRPRPPTATTPPGSRPR